MLYHGKNGYTNAPKFYLCVNCLVQTASVCYIGFPRERVKKVFSLQMSPRVERAWFKGSPLNKHAQRLHLYQHYANIRTYTQRKLPDHFLFPIANRTHRHPSTLWPSLSLSHQYARELHHLKQCEIISVVFQNANKILVPNILLLMISVLLLLLKLWLSFDSDKRKKPWITRTNNTYAFYTNSESCNEHAWQVNTFTAIVDLSRFNNSCLKSRQRRP